MLAYKNRIVEDNQTCGELFLINNELRGITYLQALVILPRIAFALATAVGVLDNELISYLIRIFIALIPHFSRVFGSLDVGKLSDK